MNRNIDLDLSLDEQLVNAIFSLRNGLVLRRLMRWFLGQMPTLDDIWQIFKSQCGQVSNWCRYQLLGLRPSIKDLEYVSETRDWKTAKIRFIASQSTGKERALLTSKDEALLYSDPDMRLEPVVLRSPQQRDVVCAAFRPWAGVELAVGGAGGVCLWYATKELVWLSYSNKDCIVDMQWLQSSFHLLTATLGSCRIQVWNPYVPQLLQELNMPLQGTHCWALRHQMDLTNLMGFLETEIPLLGYRNTLRHMSKDLTEHMPLQTATWTAAGNHLLYVVKDSSKVFGSSSTLTIGPLHCSIRAWTISEVIDLEKFCCSSKEHDGGQVHSMAMDPSNVYVAFMFTRQSFVLLCLMHIPFGCTAKLRPIKLIRSADADPTASPSCLSFGVTTYSFDHQKRSLIIAWSTGRVQTEEIIAESLDEALTFKECETKHSQQLYEIDSQFLLE